MVKLVDFDFVEGIRLFGVDRNRIDINCYGTNIFIKDIFWKIRQIIYLVILL